METGIMVGNKVDGESSKALAEFVKAVFESASKNHMDRDIIITALQLFNDISEAPSHVSIANNDIMGEKLYK